MERAVQDAIEARAPHDDLTFEELASTYSFGRVSDRRTVFVRLILKELARGATPRRALDIGCGTGISEQKPINRHYLAGVRAHCDELWGIEPDPTVTPPEEIDRFQRATLETADLPPGHFHVAYSYFVMEHVEDVGAFLEKVYASLAPGGVYLFITPNGRHFFTLAAKLLKALRLDEIILRLIRGQMVEEYHYPVQYRCNDERTIARMATAAGFDPPAFAYFESYGMTSYFRGPLRPILWILMAKRRWWHRRGCLLNMVVRLQKPR